MRRLSPGLATPRRGGEAAAADLSIYLSIYLSLSLYLSTYLSICLSISLSIYISPDRPPALVLSVGMVCTLLNYVYHWRPDEESCPKPRLIHLVRIHAVGNRGVEPFRETAAIRRANSPQANILRVEVPGRCPCFGGRDPDRVEPVKTQDASAKDGARSGKRPRESAGEVPPSWSAGGPEAARARPAHARGDRLLVQGPASRNTRPVERAGVIARHRLNGFLTRRVPSLFSCEQFQDRFKL